LRIREIAHARPRFGYQRIHVMLRREGWPVNKKRVRRLYRLDGLQLRTWIRRRKHICLHRGPVPVPNAPHERWSMDFVHDQLFDGRPFPILTVVDQLSRASPLIEVDFAMSGQRVTDALEAPDTQRVRSQPSGEPGPEVSRTLDQNCLRTGPTSVHGYQDADSSESCQQIVLVNVLHFSLEFALSLSGRL
jgi:putative transposase